jgi:hypothetical protein
LKPKQRGKQQPKPYGKQQQREKQQHLLDEQRYVREPCYDHGPLILILNGENDDDEILPFIYIYYKKKILNACLIFSKLF